MFPCGTPELSDLRIGQIIKWVSKTSGRKSIWILVEELTHTKEIGNRNFKMWCLATYDNSTNLQPGGTTQYEFNHGNVSSYEIISGV
jgi:hypothetical protein